MGGEKDRKRVTAIVPAYNEAQRIGRVLEVLVSCPNFSEIIVVDDGSTDSTGEVAVNYKVRYIKNPINKGKGYAMDVGVKAAKNDIIFFADADVIGLTCSTVNEIIEPVVSGNVDMFIGMRNRKIYYLSYVIAFVPLFGGERALTKALWHKLPDYYKYYFRVEAGLNFYAEHYGRGFGYKIFEGLSQVIKERKYGLLEGTRQRVRLIANVASAQLKLQFADIPDSVRERRMAVAAVFQGAAGMVIGTTLALLTYISPQAFIYRAYPSELNGMFGPLLVESIFHAARTASGSAIFMAGLAIAAVNFVFLALNVKKLATLRASLRQDRSQN